MAVRITHLLDRLRARSPRPAGTQSRPCIRCGGAIAPVLGSLGSVTCHDCRPSTRVVGPSGAERVGARG